MASLRIERSSELEARMFDRHVAPEPNSGCWLWTGGYGKDGYALMRFTVSGRATCTSAHRAMWQLRHGPMRSDRYACHSCDTPACVNPDHVWPGTPTQNNRDCKAKGRARYRQRKPDRLSSKRAKVADAEAAALDAAVPLEDALRLIRRAYKGRDPSWLSVRLLRVEAERSHPLRATDASASSALPGTRGRA